MAKAKPKREYGTGGLFRYKNSSKWTIQYRTLDGRCLREATGTSSRQEAMNLLTQKLAAVGRGETVERVQHYTVRQLWDAMVARYRDDNRPRAVRDLGIPTDLEPNDPNYPPQGRWKNIGPAFGHMAARAVTTESLNQYVAQRKATGAAAATINRELGALRGAFNLAYEETPPRLPRVPKFPHLRENNVRKGFVTWEQFEALCTAAGDLWLRTMLELGFTYGWREGEMLGLRCRQVDLKARTIRLDVGTTKNKEGREVMMTPQVHALLTECVSDKKPDDHVLTRVVLRSGKGKAQLPIHDVRDAWQALCCRVLPDLCWQTCKLCGHRQPTATTCGKCKRFHRAWRYSGQWDGRGLLVHDLRRSMAKAARANGTDMKTIMDAGGWKTIGVFHRYSIGDRADQQRYATAMQQARAQAAQQQAEQICGRLVGGADQSDLASMPVKSLKPA